MMMICKIAHRIEDGEEVFKSRQLGNEFLDHFTEGLKNAVVINGGEVEIEVHGLQPGNACRKGDCN